MQIIKNPDGTTTQVPDCAKDACHCGRHSVPFVQGVGLGMVSKSIIKGMCYCNKFRQNWFRYRPSNSWAVIILLTVSTLLVVLTSEEVNSVLPWIIPSYFVGVIGAAKFIK